MHNKHIHLDICNTLAQWCNHRGRVVMRVLNMFWVTFYFIHLSLL